MWRAGLAAFCLTAVSALALEPPYVLAPDGINELKIGKEVGQVERTLHANLQYSQFARHGCAVLTTDSLTPLGISIVIEAKHLSRVNVDFYADSDLPQTIKTEAGVGLGSSEADVLSAYGDKAKVAPNPQDPTWHTITVETPDHQSGIVFETNGKSVKSMRAGTNPTLAYPLPCN